MKTRDDLLAFLADLGVAQTTYDHPAVFTVGATTAASSPGVSILENGAAADTITVALALDANSRMFARLRVSIGP